MLGVFRESSMRQPESPLQTTAPHPNRAKISFSCFHPGKCALNRRGSFHFGCARNF